MRAQAREQGRYLGGRPPHGYRLGDAGSHPNAVHADWGRRLRRLEPDPTTAPTVRWIFEQRLAGHSVASIARLLNENGVPCPSIMDPARNRHRAGDGWSLRTVAAILANPGHGSPGRQRHGEVPGPGPRQQVHGRTRRGLRRRRHRHRQDQHPRPAHERDHGTLGGLMRSRTPRPDLDREPGPPDARGPRIRDLLQRAPDPPRRGTPAPACAARQRGLAMLPACIHR
jgi:hypothetical protein